MTTNTSNETSWQLMSDGDLDSISGAHVDIHNIISRANSPLAVEHAGETIKLAINNNVTLPSPLTLGISIGDQLGTIQIPAYIIGKIATNNFTVAPGIEITASLALQLEYSLLPIIEKLEVLFSEKISLLAPDEIKTSLNLLEMTFCISEFEEKDLFLNLYLPSILIKKIISIYNNHAPKNHASANNLNINVSLINGYQDITLAELYSLRNGDAIILNPEESVLVSDFLKAPVQHDTNTTRLLETPYQFFYGDFYMATENDNNNTEDKENHNAISSDSIDNMPVRIVCEVGRLSLPLKDVRELKEGSIVSLSRSLESSVDILANGQRIGRGSLIKIDDVMGLRIDYINLGD